MTCGFLSRGAGGWQRPAAGTGRFLGQAWRRPRAAGSCTSHQAGHASSGSGGRGNRLSAAVVLILLCVPDTSRWAALTAVSAGPAGRSKPDQCPGALREGRCVAGRPPWFTATSLLTRASLTPPRTGVWIWEETREVEAGSPRPQGAGPSRSRAGRAAGRGRQSSRPPGAGPARPSGASRRLPASP